MTPTLYIVIAFLGVSILFYVLFAGADFGGGILDLLIRGPRAADERKLIAHAMAPVWEANHIWLVLAVVILFMGFPQAYILITTHLYMPLMAILIGIVFRGCAFTFRHYDAAGYKLSRIYSVFFSLSSLWTSIFLGVLVGAIILGRIQPDSMNHYDLFISPWFNPFCFTLGLFTASLFLLLASLYLIGEAYDEELRRSFTLRARFAGLLVVLLGPFVFLTAEWSGFSLLNRFLESKVSVGSFAVATVLLYPFWRSLLGLTKSIQARLLGASIVSLVLFGAFGAQYPRLISITSISSMHGTVVLDKTFEELAAPFPTLLALRNALLLGVVLIIPALTYLFMIFKWETLERENELGES